MSDDESDVSLSDTEQHNDDDTEVYQEPEPEPEPTPAESTPEPEPEPDEYVTVKKKGLDRKTSKDVKVKKPRTPAQIAATQRMLEGLKKRRANQEETLKEKKVLKEKKEDPNEILLKQVEKEEKEKKLIKKANKKVSKKAVKEITKNVVENLPMKEVYKEKIIYMIPTQDGFIQSDTIPRLTKKEFRRMENDEMVTKKELEIGKKILRTKENKEDKRSTKPKTDKQMAAARKMVADRAERVKKQKEANKKEMNTEIKKALVEVVSKPLSQVQKELNQPKYTFDIIPI